MMQHHTRYGSDSASCSSTLASFAVASGPPGYAYLRTTSDRQYCQMRHAYILTSTRTHIVRQSRDARVTASVLAGGLHSTGVDRVKRQHPSHENLGEALRLGRLLVGNVISFESERAVKKFKTRTVRVHGEFEVALLNGQPRRLVPAAPGGQHHTVTAQVTRAVARGLAPNDTSRAAHKGPRATSAASAYQQ